MSASFDFKNPILCRTPSKHSHGKYMMVLYMKPKDCGGRCLYCFSEEGFTKSTTNNEDTALARNLVWSSLKQFQYREKAYGLKRKQGNKYELRIKGDSFANHDREYIEQFIWQIFDYLNGEKSSSFQEAYELQKNALDRCVHLTVETRPDQIDEEFCMFMLNHGIHTVEIGVQSLDDEILKLNRRGHDVDAVARCTKLLKDCGFEVGYHIMTGMFGSSYEKDCELLSHTLWQDVFFPDSLKIYPCMLLKEVRLQADLYECYRRGWTPYTDEIYLNMLLEVSPHFPKAVHINRIQRCFLENEIEGGPIHQIDRRQFGGISHCLWQRSVQNNDYDLNGSYENFRIVCEPQGKDVCVQALIDEATVLGYLRLHFMNDCAVIRDVRTLGNPCSIFDHNEGKMGVQHIGIGKGMMKKAEEVAYQRGAAYTVLAPSPGVASYFERLGYQPVLETHRLAKKLVPEHRGRKRDN